MVLGVVNATGLGSWPGESIRDALAQNRELLEGHLPYLPELPARGPGADLVGRTAGLLVDVAVDLQPAGWRIVDRPGRDARRTESLWTQDLDELAEAFDGYVGPLKLQVCGPWTLAGSVWLHRGERAVVDAGATRDLADSLAEGIRAHVARVRRLVPGAEPVLQLDEPSLPTILAGRLPTSSGFGKLPAVDPQVAAATLGRVVAAHDGQVLVHCCADDPPVSLLRSVGARGLSLDVTRLGPRAWEGVAVAVEDDLVLYAGLAPTRGDLPRSAVLAGQLSTQWDRVGLALDRLDRVVVTPTCGLAGATPAQARATLRACVEAAGELTERAAG